MANESVAERKEKMKQLLTHFDNIFETNTAENIEQYFNKMAMLEKVYEYFEEDFCRTDPEYDKLRIKSMQVSDILEKTFTEAEQTLFEKYWEIQVQMSALENEKIFYFGYIMAKVLDQDIEINKREEK